MWEITAEEARKLSEVIFVVLPLLALADLVEGGAELGRPSRRAVRSSDEPEDDDAARETEVRALGKAVLFYCGFVVSAALAIIGLLITPPAEYLAAEISVFFLVAWCLFSQIGDKLVADLARVYKESGGPAIIDPGRRMKPRDTRRLIGILRHRTVHTRAAGVDAATGKVWQHRRRVALTGILTVPTLTVIFLAFAIALDVVLCTSARVVGS
jgi:hypothetical protein